MRVIRDATYGFGPQFWVVDAAVTDKMITYGDYSSHRKSNERYCFATDELEKEVREFMELREQLFEWAADLKKKIDNGERP